MSFHWFFFTPCHRTATKVCSKSVLNEEHKKSKSGTAAMEKEKGSMKIGKTWSFPECNFSSLFSGEPALSRGGSGGDVTKDADDCSPLTHLHEKFATEARLLRLFELSSQTGVKRNWIYLFIRVIRVLARNKIAERCKFWTFQLCDLLLEHDCLENWLWAIKVSIKFIQ